MEGEGTVKLRNPEARVTAAPDRLRRSTVTGRIAISHNFDDRMPV
jgi:hypothetical protein